MVGETFLVLTQVPQFVIKAEVHIDIGAYQNVLWGDEDTQRGGVKALRIRRHCPLLRRQDHDGILQVALLRPLNILLRLKCRAPNKHHA